MVVPGYANPQSLNRFSYVNNNPLRYVDPTGHMIDDGCSLGCSYTPPQPVNYCDTHPGACGGGGGGGSNGGQDNPVITNNNNQLSTQNPCGGIPPYIPAFTCGGVMTEPGIVMPSTVDEPVVGGYTSDGNINFNYEPPSGFDYVSALIDGLTWLHYNSPLYSSLTGSNAQAIIPLIHHNESGLNVIPGVGVYNNTGMNLSVLSVSVSNAQIPISNSPSVPNGNLGAVQFSNPVVLPNTNITVQINFIVNTSTGIFGTGQINYDGPNYIPVYGPPAP